MTPPIKIIASFLVLAVLFESSGNGFLRQAKAAQTAGQTAGKLAAATAGCYTAALGELGALAAGSTLLGAIGVGGASATASTAGATVPVNDAVHTGVSTKQSLMDTLSEAWDKSKDCMRDMAVKITLDWIVDVTIEWIQGGGKPKFVQDWKSFKRDAVNVGVGEVAEQLGLGFLCSPFSARLQLSFQVPTKFSKQITCTLDKITKNINDFYRDFRKGGWIAYRELWRPQNNYFGAYILVSDERQRRAAEEAEAAVNEAVSGGGFLSQKRCVKTVATDELDPETGTNKEKCLQWEILTPGDTIGELAGDAVTSDAQWSRNVKSWMAAIVNAVINRLFKEGMAKMKKSTDPNYDGSGDFDPYSGMAYDPIVDYQSIAQSEFGKLQTCTSQTGGQRDKCFADLKKDKCESFVAGAAQTAGFRLAVDAQGIVGSHTSIRALDANIIFIAYEDASNRDLKLAKSINGGGAWTLRTIDSPGSVGAFTSIDATSSAIAVAYRDETNKTVKIAQSADLGNSWSIKTIDAVGTAGARPSVKLVSAATVLASYYDAVNRDLKLAQTGDGGLTWATTTVVSSGDVGDYSSLDAAGGVIFVAYRDNGNSNLKLAKSTNGGTSWTMRTIDSSGDVGAFVSLKAADQNMIFAVYYDADGANLKFAKSDSGGLYWTIKAIDSSGDVGQYPSLSVLDKNKIYVSYYDATNQQLKLAKTADGGNSWETIIADPTKYVGRYSSLAVVNEKTALISYYDETNADLKFAKADPTAKSETGALATADPDRKRKCEASLDQMNQETKEAQKIMCQVQGGTWTESECQYPKPKVAEGGGGEQCTRVAVTDEEKDCGGGQKAQRMTYSCPSSTKCNERTNKWTSEGNEVISGCSQSGNEWLITVDFCR